MICTAFITPKRIVDELEGTFRFQGPSPRNRIFSRRRKWPITQTRRQSRYPFVMYILCAMRGTMQYGVYGRTEPTQSPAAAAAERNIHAEKNPGGYEC